MKTRRTVMILFFVLASTASAAACDYVYTVIDSRGMELRIREGEQTTLIQGERYILRMEYRENHRNCNVSPEETLYLVNGARWIDNGDTQPLVLTAMPEWEQPASRTHRGDFTFTAARVGEWLVEVVRECNRGGYHGTFILEVRS